MRDDVDDGGKQTDRRVPDSGHEVMRRNSRFRLFVI